jgi:hypothetical protein
MIPTFTVDQHLTTSLLDELEKIANKQERHVSHEEKKNIRGLKTMGAAFLASLGLGTTVAPLLGEKPKNVQLPPAPPPRQRKFKMPPMDTTGKGEGFRDWFNDLIAVNEHGDRGNTQQIARVDKIREQMGVKRDELKYHVDSGRSPAIMLEEGAKPTMHVPSNTKESVIAHEFGHIKNDKLWGKRGRKLNTGSRAISALGALPAAYYAGWDDDPSYKPALAQAAVSAPMLIDEGIASGRAIKHLMKQHGKLKGLKKSMILAPALATYGLAAGAPLAITAGRKYLNKKKEKHEDANGSNNQE